MRTAPTLYPTKVVLTAGRDRAPARLVVSVDLGYGFPALSPEMQREAIERGLADACVLAESELDAIGDTCHASNLSSEPAESVVADQPSRPAVRVRVA